MAGRSSVWSVAAVLICAFSLVLADVNATLVNEADAAFKARQFTKADSMYSQAIREGAEGYIYCKRAVVRRAQSKYTEALQDMTSCLESKDLADNTRASYQLRQKADLLLLTGQVDLAQKELKSIKKSALTPSEVEEKAAMTKRAKTARELQKKMPTNDMGALRELLSITKFDYHQMDSICTRALRAQNVDVMQLAAQKMKDAFPDDAQAMVHAAQALLLIGDPTRAYQHMRHAMDLDPDNSDALKVFRRMRLIKKLDEGLDAAEQRGDWAAVLEVDGDRRDLDLPSVLKMKIAFLQCRGGVKTGSDGVGRCTKALSLAQRFSNASTRHTILLLRSEAHQDADDLDAATADVQKVLSEEPNHQEAHGRMQALEKARRMADRVDHYKVLGVPRTADDKTIKRAHRKLAMQYHPDRAENEEQRAEYEEKFTAIGMSYEVLSTPEKRAAYDRGDDEQQGGFPGGGFHGGFPGFMFGGGFQQQPRGFRTQHSSGGHQQFHQRSGSGPTFTFRRG